MSVWFITGASRGFGRALTGAALAEGHEVVATARDPRAISSEHGSPEQLLALPLDVTDSRQAEEAVAAAVERFGRIDVLVNNAGYGLFGAVEEVSDAEARAIFDTNVFGLLAVTRAVLPTLREQGSGRILNLGSSAGFASSAGRGLYSAAKFAVEGVSEALRAELAPLGIQVTVVEPGSFRTEFLSAESRRTPQRQIDAYGNTVGTFQQAVEASAGKQPGNPDLAVAAMLDLASAPEPPMRLPLGSDCVALIEDKLASVADELGRWRHVSTSTDY